MQLAQINIARTRFSLDDPRMAGFVDNLGRINALAERSPGFVWRLQDDGGNATGISVYEDPRLLINMSVWEGIEALEAFAYRTVHRRFVQRRGAWFERLDEPHFALWMTPPGVLPNPEDGKRRLAHLARFGPTAFAFSFAQRFSPTSDIAPLGEGGDAPPTEPHRPCG